jgi:hypothetical protein
MDIWYILRPIDIFLAICYNLWEYCHFFPVLVHCTKTNLATPHLALEIEKDKILLPISTSGVYVWTNEGAFVKPEST